MPDLPGSRIGCSSAIRHRGRWARQRLFNGLYLVVLLHTLSAMKRVLFVLGALIMSSIACAQEVHGIWPLGAKEDPPDTTTAEVMAQANEASAELALLRTLLDAIMHIRPVLVAEKTCPSGWEMSDISPGTFDDRYLDTVLCKPPEGLLATPSDPE